MAFVVIYDKPWFKRPFENMIEMYRKKLYNDWFNQLSDDEKKQELKRKEETKNQNKELISLFFSIPLMYRSNRTYV